MLFLVTTVRVRTKVRSGHTYVELCAAMPSFRRCLKTARGTAEVAYTRNKGQTRACGSITHSHTSHSVTCSMGGLHEPRVRPRPMAHCPRCQRRTVLNKAAYVSATSRYIANAPKHHVCPHIHAPMYRTRRCKGCETMLIMPTGQSAGGRAWAR